MTQPLRVILVDDEPLAIDRLRILLDAIPGVMVAGTADTSEDAVALTSSETPDAVLLDIGMPEVDGISTARRLGALPAPPAIIFVTAFDQHAVVAFDLNAVDYLVKPVEPERLARALDRARAAIARPGAQVSPQGFLRELWVSEREGIRRIPVTEIDRVTGERDYVRVFSGGASWLARESLSGLATQLDPQSFVRVHRSAIVRRDFVARLRSDRGSWIATLADGTAQRIGRKHLPSVLRLLGLDT